MIIIELKEWSHAYTHTHTHVFVMKIYCQDLFHTLENSHKFVQKFLSILIKEPIFLYFTYSLFKIPHIKLSILYLLRSKISQAFYQGPKYHKHSIKVQKQYKIEI